MPPALENALIQLAVRDITSLHIILITLTLVGVGVFAYATSEKDEL